MVKPTHKDAELMLQIAQWNSMSGVPEAMNWLWSDEFVSDYTAFVKKYPPGSDGYLKASRICGAFETIGTLYKNNLLNKELLFDWIAVAMVWKRIKGFALGARQEAGEPRLYENFEMMAKDSKA
jgi:hypothetical protein